MSMENRAIVRRLYEEVWNKRRFELLDELISPSYVLQAAHLAGPVIGPEAYKYYVLAFFKGFPDGRLSHRFSHFLKPRGISPPAERRLNRSSMKALVSGWRIQWSIRSLRPYSGMRCL